MKGDPGEARVFVFIFLCREIIENVQQFFICKLGIELQKNKIFLTYSPSSYGVT